MKKFLSKVKKVLFFIPMYITDIVVGEWTGRSALASYTFYGGTNIKPVDNSVDVANTVSSAARSAKNISEIPGYFKIAIIAIIVAMGLFAIIGKAKKTVKVILLSILGISLASAVYFFYFKYN
jgi:hypothetical protein